MSDLESDADSRVVTENEDLNRMVTRSRARLAAANVSDPSSESEQGEEQSTPLISERNKRPRHPQAVAGMNKRARVQPNPIGPPASVDDEDNEANQDEEETAESLVPLPVSDRVSKIMTVGLEPSQAKALRANFSPKFEDPDFSVNVPMLDESLYVRFKLPGNPSSEAEEKRLQSLQFKLLDCAKPMFELRGLLTGTLANPRHKELVDLALDLWAVAFNNMTHARRKNVMKITNPKLLIMLNNRKHFDPKDSDQLFGEKFTRAVVRESKNIASCEQAEKLLEVALQAKTKRRSNTSTQRP